MSRYLFIFLLLVFTQGTFSQEYGMSRYQLLSGVKQGPGKIKQTTLLTKESANQPSSFIVSNFHYIPSGSDVLDINLDEGKNAVFLATKGYNVTGLATTPYTIQISRQLAQNFGVRINALLTEIHQLPSKGVKFNAIICTSFFAKHLIPKLKSLLNPGGVLLVEGNLDNGKTPAENKNENSFKSGDLLKLFPGLKVLKYEEPPHIDKVYVILQKAKS